MQFKKLTFICPAQFLFQLPQHQAEEMGGAANKTAGLASKKEIIFFIL